MYCAKLQSTKVWGLYIYNIYYAICTLHTCLPEKCQKKWYNKYRFVLLRAIKRYMQKCLIFVICLNFFQDMSEICLRLAWYMAEICLKTVWICLRYEWICQRYARDLLLVCILIYLHNCILAYSHIT